MTLLQRKRAHLLNHTSLQNSSCYSL